MNRIPQCRHQHFNQHDNNGYIRSKFSVIEDSLIAALDGYLEASFKEGRCCGGRQCASVFSEFSLGAEMEVDGYNEQHTHELKHTFRVT